MELSAWQTIFLIAGIMVIAYCLPYAKKNETKRRDTFAFVLNVIEAEDFHANDQPLALQIFCMEYLSELKVNEERKHRTGYGGYLPGALFLSSVMLFTYSCLSDPKPTYLLVILAIGLFVIGCLAQAHANHRLNMSPRAILLEEMQMQYKRLGVDSELSADRFNQLASLGVSAARR